ncbi:aryl-alcohol dehydrogenase [Parafrankia irregularis]|uniref:Aryl-alcohol dehydrogenase n=1 Tax=Parafrankia irregularis TaxID=795642 RepID=A0A0S4QYU5_9ACTN|nr:MULTISPECIES: NAD(P)-dependent alcohol dehydrogenase [Parafrankia]MBE3200312.1 NAD(P)-dependent alcohol dehydrogenase [Parafrankia sp. CH37]CUU59718.1 aryl-alcohol dehydrogenase [Parafrankia irregularis]
MKVTAAVLDELGAEFSLRPLELADPAPGEVLVEIVGVGLCHTDLAVQHGHLPFPFPAVVGHEGSGVVRAVGAGVTKVVPGDSVALTFNSCGACSECLAGSPAYCARFMEVNFGGVGGDGTARLHDGTTDVGSNFFGQSSFATHALAHEANVVKVPGGVPLELVGPLGCGVQTGAGAVLNALDCPEGSSLLVTGGGSVGLSAVMAGRVRKLSTIIVVEPVAARRDLALTLGATHVIDPAAGDVAEQVRAIIPEGVKFAVDTTAVAPVLAAVLASLAQQGEFGMVGVPSDPTAALSVGLLEMQARGLRFRGIVEGDSNPDVFIPYLVELFKNGEFPLDRLITTMSFSQINEAVAVQARGDAVKIVLTHG